MSWFATSPTGKSMPLELLRIIISNLDVASRVALTLTCKDAAAVVRDIWSLDRKLQPFFSPDGNQFRSVYLTQGSIIGGAWAAAFLAGILGQAKLDLEIYSSDGRFIGDWLLTQGYTFTPSTRQLPMWKDASRRLTKFRKRTFDAPYESLSTLDQFHANHDASYRAVDAVLSFAHPHTLNTIHVLQCACPVWTVLTCGDSGCIHLLKRKPKLNILQPRS